VPPYFELPHAYQQDFHVAPNPRKIIQLDASGKQGRYVTTGTLYNYNLYLTTETLSNYNRYITTRTLSN
jgi:hypothetical protein